MQHHRMKERKYSPHGNCVITELTPVSFGEKCSELDGMWIGTDLGKVNYYKTPSKITTVRGFTDKISFTALIKMLVISMTFFSN